MMSNFIVARRIVDEENDVITLEPIKLIKDAARDVTVREVKEVLEASGELLLDDDGNEQKWDWNDYAVVPDVKWGERKWTENPEKWSNTLPDERLNEPYEYAFTFESLEDRIYGVVRVSLRLPQGLHSKLKAKADEMSFNSYCLSVLAREVGEMEMLAKFERKPGRPRKLEIVE